MKQCLHPAGRLQTSFELRRGPARGLLCAADRSAELCMLVADFLGAGSRFLIRVIRVFLLCMSGLRIARDFAVGNQEAGLG